jgi:hypothetical protein
VAEFTEKIILFKIFVHLFPLKNKELDPFKEKKLGCHIAKFFTKN